ncbi:MAG: gamma-glutamyl-gamma-aminobutyrate hydrolase family protein [Planctomycetes bacterium]|nr:gamma-glutamyl-gamma-aminobutyrate hydrolase family protein [Planctomycetota bacterium]
MSTKPVIGINGDFRPEKKESVALSWFNTGYYDCVVQAKPGGVPILIPPLDGDEDLRQVLEMLDGLILSGSNLDLDPVRLGMEKHPATRPMPARREDFDRRLCKMAVEMRLPILAIGVGMQTLNVVCGGTLIQHISEEIPKALLHRDQVERRLRHAINIVPGTRVDNIYGPGEIRVNSQHHMAVGQVASLFRVSAVTADGVIEAFEAIEENWFCLGIQWHPENETASGLDMQVFEAFLEACATQIQPTILPFQKKAA